MGWTPRGTICSCQGTLCSNEKFLIVCYRHARAPLVFLASFVSFLLLFFVVVVVVVVVLFDFFQFLKV